MENVTFGIPDKGGGAQGLKERFYTLFRANLTRKGSEKLLEWLEKNDFFTAPASTRFHGAYEGGLLEHSLNVYDCLVSALSAAGLSDAYSPETVAIVSLLHDLCKVGVYRKGTRNVKNELGQWVTKEVWEFDEQHPFGDHSDKSLVIIQSFIRLSEDEIYAIRAHMGGFDAAAKGGSQVISRIFDRSKLAVLLHIADMAATYLMEARDD